MSEALRTFLRDLFAGTFGSQAGGAGYPIAARPSLALALTAVAVVLIVLVALRVSLTRLHRSEWMVVALWLPLAFGVQLTLSSFAYADLDKVVESPNATGFYSVSQQYSMTTLLSRFHEIAETFPLHARANLPGKTLFYDLLATITSSTQVMAWLIVFISNLGGVLVYWLAKDWFSDRLTAFYALVLYLFLPARLYFFPILNVVSPVLMLVVFWLTTRGLGSRRPVDFGLAGAALYVLTIFEPLPLAAMPLLIALVMKPVAERQLTWGRAFVLAGWSAVGFAALYLLMRAVFSFDLFSAFQFALADARAFNQASGRPYSAWVIHNLKDFVINMGLPQSIVFMVFAGAAVRRLLASPSDSIRDRDVLLPIAFVVILLALDLSGINRGETVRLWIFLGVLMQFFVARACVEGASRRLFEPVIAISLLQAAVCVQIVAWIIP